MVKDNIADFITVIKNSSRIGRESAVFPYSKLVHSIANVLHKEGYLSGVDKKGKKGGKVIEVAIAYVAKNKPKLNDIKRVSRLSRRVYEKAKNLRPVRGGFGRMVLSTPKGLMTDVEARKANVGGEILFKVW
jgi:small subunit ribosomal protein S8